MPAVPYVTSYLIGALYLYNKFLLVHAGDYIHSIIFLILFLTIFNMKLNNWM